MELYEMMQNLRNISKEEQVKISVARTKEQIGKLTTDRTCFIYSSYVYENLKKEHVSSYIISTKDMGYEYEHRFVLVPNNLSEGTYFLIDLTFSQFMWEDYRPETFNKLLNEGYQEINQESWDLYLDYVVGYEKGKNPCRLEDVLYGQGKDFKKR